ncbi:phage replisome organizer N-terminal domain-containing protein [Jeotgalibaca porci]|uniref:phage replisome organizer N-terminal domain-containing protein n=1 Tax=Jeotgalibaca porci TaxID=1868793 RepID=UPI0035A0C5AD
MATEVKWIKLDVSIPDNKKVKRIRKMPDGNNIILFWVFLLSRAGESNQKGGLFFTENVPYTEEDLAADFDFSTEFVRFAIMTLEKYRMIELYDDIIFIKNWDEYQQLDKLEKIKEQNRLRQAKYKEKQKLIANSNSEVTLPVTQGNATDIELDIELDKDKDIDKKPKKSKHGEFNNVLLTKQELEKLKEKYPHDYLQRVERVSGYVASTGKSYKSHYATIISWARKDEQIAPQKKVVNSDWEKQMQELME